MPEYSFYTLNLSGVVDTAKRLRCDDDDKAMAHARSLLHPDRVEVWADKRRIGIVPPTIDRRVTPSRR